MVSFYKTFKKQEIILRQNLIEDKMDQINIKNIIYSCVLILLFSFGINGLSAQSQPKGESLPETKLGEIRFQRREIGSPPSQLRMLEIQIEVFNRSPRSTAPPHSIKVIVTPKEIKLPEGASGTEFNLNPEEVSLDLPLPPSTGRVLMIGFPLLETKPESITFEIQINPPGGEKKIVTWIGSGN